MAKRTPQWVLYGDHGFREAMRRKTPGQIRREIEETARRSIERSTRAGLRLVRSKWPWLRTLQPEPANDQP